MENVTSNEDLVKAINEATANLAKLEKGEEPPKELPPAGKDALLKSITDNTEKLSKAKDEEKENLIKAIRDDTKKLSEFKEEPVQTPPPKEDPLEDVLTGLPEDEIDLLKSLQPEDGDKAVTVAGWIMDLTRFYDAAMSSLVKSIDRMGKRLDVMEKSLKNGKGVGETAEFAKSQRLVLEGTASLLKSMDGMSKRLEAVESTPQERRAFPEGKPGYMMKSGFGEEKKPATKREVAMKLGVLAEAGKVEASDVLLFEASGQVSPRAKIALDAAQ